jgi:tRNA dimethylallyltransferase
LWLAERLPIEIISMDSAMVYRGMDIGTAKPSEQQRAAVAHHLIDIRDPSESYSAGSFVADTVRLAEQITARGRLPLIVGGTMMYLRALRSGLARLPRADERLRSAIDAQAQREGWPALHGLLAQIDPDAARRIAPGDRQRIQRAIEVYRLSGRPLSAHLRAGGAEAPIELLTIALVPEDRSALHAAIARRFDRMLERGFVSEVESLHKRNDLHGDLAALRCVGYRQIWAHLEGACSLAQARERAIVATRQLAKRQLTWLRSDPAEFAVAAENAGRFERVLGCITESGHGWS